MLIENKKKYIVVSMLNWGLLIAITTLLILALYFIFAFQNPEIQQNILYHIIGVVSIYGFLISAIFSFVISILIRNKLVPESQKKWLTVKRIIAGILFISALLFLIGIMIVTKLGSTD